MRVTIRHRYSAIEKLIAYYSRGQNFSEDKAFGCRAATSRQFVAKLAPQLLDNSVSLRVPSPSGGRYTRVAELVDVRDGNLSGEREISSRAPCHPRFAMIAVPGTRHERACLAAFSSNGL
jgi:hypothetical protein